MENIRKQRVLAYTFLVSGTLLCGGIITNSLINVREGNKIRDYTPSIGLRDLHGKILKNYDEDFQRKWFLGFAGLFGLWGYRERMKKTGVLN